MQKKFERQLYIVSWATLQFADSKQKQKIFHHLTVLYFAGQLSLPACHYDTPKFLIVLSQYFLSGLLLLL